MTPPRPDGRRATNDTAASFTQVEASAMAIAITVNGEHRSLDVEPDTPLLWAIRDTLGLTGTKFGCGISACGACTVHLNGRPVRSCTLPVSAAEGASVTTIEGLAAGGTLHKVQQAWIAQQVPQCGYCQSGMIMAVAALLDERPRPTDQEIDLAITNICRCGTFVRVRRAIHAIAEG
jgi:isoquinoline 1-oxidoreductase alpha subunit